MDSKFALALCCLREDYSNLGKLFDACVRDGLEVDAFLTWALFNNARKQQIFQDKMREHFNIEVEAVIPTSRKRRKGKVAKQVDKPADVVQ